MVNNEYHMSKIKMNTRIEDKDMRINNLEYQYDPRILEDGAKRVFEIDKQNMQLLKTLNVIMRTKGKTDCWRNEFIDNNAVELEKEKRMKIATENRQMYNRIRSSVGEYTVTEIERDGRIDRTSLKNKSKLSSLKGGHTAITNKNSLKSSKAHQLFISLGLKTQKYPRCYFELQVVESKKKLGKLIFELYPGIVPKTCENFLALCMGDNGLSYQNTPLHRIISGYLCQGGDVTNFNGSGGTSIYAGDFEDENFELKHISPGMLSMCNTGKDTNNSKFNLTFKKLEVLDGKNVVFGKIVNGLPIIYEIDAMGTKIGKPKKKVIISKCGIC